MDKFKEHFMKKFGLVEKSEAPQKPAAKVQKPSTDAEAQSERARVKGIMSLPGDHAKLEWLAYSTNVTVEDAQSILAKDDAETEAKEPEEFDVIGYFKDRAKGRGGVAQ
jgi:hypothetical protein